MTQQETVTKKNNSDENKRSERGASLVEYALLVGLIAVVCIAGIRLFGQRASQSFSLIANQLTTSTTTSSGN